MDEKRLDRIEQKIDRLADAITAIARVEEKMLASNSRVDALEKRVATTENDLQAIAIMSRKNSGIAAFADKAFWLVIGGLGVLAASFIKSD